MSNPKVDHLVIAARTLEEGSDYIFQTLGVRPEKGGEHSSQGTHNLVMRLGEDCYLEVIAVNPKAEKPVHPRWFELDSESMQERLSRSPLLVTWAVRTDDIDQLALRSTCDLGRVLPMSRGNLRWKLTVTEDGHMPGKGLIPFLIQWSIPSPHPASSMFDSGCILKSLRGLHPHPYLIMDTVRTIGIDHFFSVEPTPISATPSLIATIKTPMGLRIIT